MLANPRVEVLTESVWDKHGQHVAAVFTQRTRSFLFAALGLIVARMFRRSELSFYENGVVSINLPIVEHVLGSRATRTTHPRVLKECSKLFSLLLGEDFRIQNPYLCKTKADVIRVIAERNCHQLIPDSFSCAKVREATRSRQHCGVCSQCVDRRFGMLAAGLEAYDPVDNYAVDLFTGEHQPGNDLTMIESYVLRAQKLASMTLHGFVSTYGQAFRVIPHLPGPVDEVARMVWDLHRRYGKEVTSVVDSELSKHAHELPATSLLAMLRSPSSDQPAYVDPVEREPSAAAQAAADHDDYAWEPICFGVDDAQHRVVLSEGIELTSGDYALFSILAKQFDSDRAAGLRPQRHEFKDPEKLASELQIEQPTLRKRIARIRRRIDEAFLNQVGRPLEIDDVIQNESRKGYRLNPFLIRVSPAELRNQSGRMSQVGVRGVTPLSGGL